MSNALVVLAVVAALLLILPGILVLHLGKYWLQAYMSGADVSMASLIAMSLLGIQPHLIVTSKIMARQARLTGSGLPGNSVINISTSALIAHHLAGGSVMQVVRAIIVAHRAGIDLDFDRAATIDLAGRDVLLAVKTSVSPTVISCPRQDGTDRKSLSAVAKNGVEILVVLKVTVRTNLEQLVGGATEETIIARCGEEIIAAVGAASSHMDVLACPSQISERAMTRHIDVNCAFSIISIDIATIDLGTNIGARLQTEQAWADTQVALAQSEARRVEAMADIQEMKAKQKAAYAQLILAEACVPRPLAAAFRAGQFDSCSCPLPCVDCLPSGSL